MNHVLWLVNVARREKPDTTKEKREKNSERQKFKEAFALFALNVFNAPPRYDL